MVENPQSHKYNQAKKFFRIKYPYLRQEAEDFAQWCASQWLTGRSLKTKFEYLAIDYFRSESLNGITDRRSDIWKISNHYREEIYPNFNSANSSHLKRFEDGLLLRSQLLTSIERAILILIYEWGFHSKEIADCFGITEGRICQQLKMGLTKIKGE